MLDTMARLTSRPAKEVEQAKMHSGKAGGSVAKDVRDGKVAHRDIRGEIDVAAYEHAREAKKRSPLFAMFGKAPADSIAKITKEDSVGERLMDIKKALGNIELDEDIEIVKRLAFECGYASKRFEKWQTTFTNPRPSKAMPVKAIDCSAAARGSAA